MLRPSTRIKLAERAALRRRYGVAALRVLRRGMRAAISDHVRRTLGPTSYAGSAEESAIRRAYLRAVRRLVARWPSLLLEHDPASAPSSSRPPTISSSSKP